MHLGFSSGALVLALLVSACTKKTTETQGDPSDPKAMMEKGRMVYVTNCTSCHGTDPKIDGALGPAVQGASFELLEKRIIDGTYPENYKPKRDTKIMQPLPFLKNDLKALHAYLNK